MLRGRLIHPDLLRALATAGHGARVLIADGNYPVATRAPAAAARIYLNLAPGVLNVTDVLEVLTAAIPIEAAAVMVPADRSEPPVFAEMRRLLAAATTAPGTGPERLELSPLSREGFYAAASSPDVAVVIATGERRVYANILLTVGVVDPGS